MEKSYVEQHDGGFWIKGTRISLDSVVYAFKRGAAPETIQRSFSLLTLEQVFGAITFYLAHEEEIDTYLEKSEADWEIRHKEINAKFKAESPELFERLEKARQTR